jgi:GT2 family glycosyltransferase
VSTIVGTVDVVVLTFNDADDARRAVDSALASTGVDVSVHVVDNGSTVPFPGHGDPRVTVDRVQQNLGVGGGRNRGASLGDAEFVCFLDSDAALRPDTLRDLVGALRAHPDAALAAPVFAGQPPEIGAGRAPSVFRKVARGVGLTSTYAPTRRDGDRIWDVEFAIGACQVVRREALNEVGGIDDRHLFGPEDVDLCLRLRERGWQILQSATAVCDHEARRGSRRPLTRRWWRHLAAVVAHHRRHGWLSRHGDR